MVTKQIIDGLLDRADRVADQSTGRIMKHAAQRLRVLQVHNDALECERQAWLQDQEKYRWIPVTERLPENEVDVLVLAERRLYGIRELDRKTVRVVATAFHTDGKMNTEESGYNWELDNVDMEYDEDADAFIVPEGWWEAVRYGEEFSAVDDFVTHWMPLPEPPGEVDHESET